VRHLAPLVTLPPQRLLARLAEEYVFAQLCEAIMLSFAAENEARMRAMIAARVNVHDKLDQLIGDSRRLRQEEITAEIVELSSGSLASSDASRKQRQSR
jgi:F-type H+-transporting ATPase subunit gamma